MMKRKMDAVVKRRDARAARTGRPSRRYKNKKGNIAWARQEGLWTKDKVPPFFRRTI